MVTSSTETPLIVIVGQTASGKSALAMELAQTFNGEIICADSRTVYIGMDVGTAKPSPEDQQKIRHYALNITTPSKPVTVADFKKLATEAINDIVARGKLPIMVGGTGLYIDGVIFDFEFRQDKDVKLRAELSKLAIEELQARIQSSDIPLPENSLNPRHLIRTLETNGHSSKSKPLRSNTLMIGLEVERDVLKVRIINRLETMLARGLETEVKTLVDKYGWEIEPLKTIGYRQFQPYFSGQATLEQAKAEIIKDTIAYAKRQHTWFKRNSSIHWVQEQRQAVDLVTTFLNK